VWTLSEGNPFVVVECMHALPDASAGAEAVALPKRAREMIGVRLERLGDHARQVGAVAAVVGRECGFPLLQRAAGLSAAETADALEQLVSRRLVTAVGERFELAHDRIRRVVYEGLLAPRRAALHAAVGEALEAFHAGRLEEVYDQLAEHYSQAGIPEKAATYLAELATVARQRYAFEEAIRVLDQAFDQTDRLTTPERERRRLRLVLEKAWVLSGLARFREISALLLPLRELADNVGDPALAGQYFFRLELTHHYLGEEREAAEAAERAAAAADRAGDRAIAGQARYVLALQSYGTEPRPGIEHARLAITLLSGTGELVWLGLAHWILGMNHILLGEAASALRSIAEAEAIGDTIDDARLRSLTASSKGWALAIRGDAEAAIEACRRARELSRDPLARASAAFMLGCAYLEIGDAARALAPLEEATEQQTRFGMRQSFARGLALLGEACLASGDLARAGEVAVRAVTVGAETGARWALAWAERTPGRLARGRGAMEEARRHLGGAMNAFTAMESRLEAARTQLDLAEVTHALGDRAQARAILTEAVDIFRDLDLPKRVEQAAARARRLGVEDDASPSP
jgi:tetratricopeptide (TPR) repeat protein